MAAKTLAQLLIKFNTRLGDTLNTTFTAGEKTEMLREAINDPYVYKVARDDTTTIVDQQNSYDLPSNMEDLFSVELDQAGNGYSAVIDPAAYDVIDGTLYFQPEYQYLLAGQTLMLIGKVKLTEFDLIDDFIQDYVLHTAMVAALTSLSTRLAMQFLTNDMTMGDLIAAIRFHQGEVARLRARIINQHAQVL